jgi:hypothetical protein
LLKKEGFMDGVFKPGSVLVRDSFQSLIAGDDLLPKTQNPDGNAPKNPSKFNRGSDNSKWLATKLPTIPRNWRSQKPS